MGGIFSFLDSNNSFFLQFFGQKKRLRLVFFSFLVKKGINGVLMEKRAKDGNKAHRLTVLFFLGKAFRRCTSKNSIFFLFFFTFLTFSIKTVFFVTSLPSFCNSSSFLFPTLLHPWTGHNCWSSAPEKLSTIILCWSMKKKRRGKNFCGYKADLLVCSLKRKQNF